MAYLSEKLKDVLPVVGVSLSLAGSIFGEDEVVRPRHNAQRVDSLLEFKSFFFLKEVQGNALSFLSALSFLNSASDESTGHLLGRGCRAGSADLRF